MDEMPGATEATKIVFSTHSLAASVKELNSTS